MSPVGAPGHVEEGSPPICFAQVSAELWTGRGEAPAGGPHRGLLSLFVLGRGRVGHRELDEGTERRGSVQENCGIEDLSAEELAGPGRPVGNAVDTARPLRSGPRNGLCVHSVSC